MILCKIITIVGQQSNVIICNSANFNLILKGTAKYNTVKFPWVQCSKETMAELSPAQYYWVFPVLLDFSEFAQYSLSKTGHFAFCSVFLGFC